MRRTLAETRPEVALTEPQNPKRSSYIGLGALIGLGAGVGLVVGVIVGSIALGLVFGAALGTVVGAVIESNRRKPKS